MTDWMSAPLPNIMIAPNGARKVKADHPAIPISVAEVAQTALACHKAGAGAIHFHVRDDDDKHVFDVGQYREGLAEMGRLCPQLHLQITTETVGLYNPDDMRQLIRNVMPPGASVGVSEMIPSRQPDADDVRFYEWMADAGIRVQHICYAPEDVVLLGKLLAQLPASHNHKPWCLFVLGHYTGAVSHPDLLVPFLDEVASAGIDADWAICAFATEEAACLDAAIAAGGKVRVGFENSMIMRDGTIAANNEARASEASQLFAAAGRL